MKSAIQNITANAMIECADGESFNGQILFSIVDPENGKVVLEKHADATVRGDEKKLVRPVWYGNVPKTTIQRFKSKK